MAKLDEVLNRSAELSAMPEVTVTGTNASADHVFSFYDGLGWKTFSNENGGVWTRTFFDGTGNVTKEVRFRTRDYSDPLNPTFVDTVVDLKTRPSLAQLLQDYDAAVAAHDPAAGVDTVRITEFTFDAAHNQLSETGVSRTYGRVTNEYRYDRFGNKVREVTAKGRVDAHGNSLEQDTEYTYDAANRVTRTTVGPFQFVDSNGTGYWGTASVSMTYDSRGFKSTETSERGYVKRLHYDAQGRLIREWDAGKQDAATGAWTSTLQTDYAYDAFGRALQKTETDLTARASVASRSATLQYDNFDEVVAYDLAGRVTRMQYDAGGNKIAETNALDATELYQYDGENRLVARTDRLGFVSFKSYDAYGHVLSETDGNGRVTTYTIGAFGQVLEKHMSLARGIQVDAPPPPPPLAAGGICGFIRKIISFVVSLQRALQPGAGGVTRNLQEGAGESTETTAYDWAGRAVQITDSYGKNIQNLYDDADRLRGIDDLAQNQASTYAYDARGLRVQETSSKDGALLRDQTNSYNSRGWLVGVDTEASVSFGGSTLSEPVSVFFRYDQAGNHVWVGDNHYVYDGENRMLMGFDGKSHQVVEAMQYDGYGNRVSIQQAGTTTTYSYSAQGEVLAGSNGEAWSYDALGNATFHRAANGDTQSTTYDAESRAVSVMATSGGQSTRMVNGYDGAGNLGMVRSRGQDYAFDEVTYRDVRYNEIHKRVENSWAKGADGLRGETTYRYDANGQLLLVDRGRKQDAHENTVAEFAYDNEGHIIARADRALADTDAGFFQGYVTDPDTTLGSSNFFRRFFAQIARQALLNGLQTGVTHLQSLVYADGKPVAETSTEHHLELKKLTLVGGEAVRDGSGRLIGWTIALQSEDIARNADGTVDRTATARNIAMRVYSGFAELAEESQARVVSYIQGQLPASDADIAVGTRISVHGFIHLLNGTYQNTQVRTDYSVKQIGQEGMPLGQIVSYVVRAGDTLQGIASQYYGSPSYWYLIAGANGLSGSEQLKEGTTLTIPNASANSVNNSNTYKVYNENDIIGSTSPEIVTIPKKKKWYQKLIQVLIVVILVVVAVLVAIYAPVLFGVVAGAIGGVLGVVAAVAVTAAAGYAVGVATSYVTQGLAIAAGLQEKFDWKAAKNMGKSFAVIAASAAIVSWAETANLAPELQTAIRVGAELGSQYLQNDGHITNWSGVALAFIPGGQAGAKAAEQASTWGQIVNFVNKNRRTVTAGLQLAEKAARGKGVNTLDWTGVAVAGITQSMSVNPYYNYDVDGASIDWARVGQEALVAGVSALVVGSRLGQEAGLNFLGTQLGNLAGGVVGEKIQVARAEALLGEEAVRRMMSGPGSDAEKLSMLTAATKKREQDNYASNQADLAQLATTARVHVAANGTTMSDAGGTYGDVNYGAPLAPTAQGEAMTRFMAGQMQNGPPSGAAPIMLDDFGNPIAATRSSAYKVLVDQQAQINDAISWANDNLTGQERYQHISAVIKNYAKDILATPGQSEDMLNYSLALLRGTAAYGASVTQDVDPLKLGMNERYSPDIALAGFLYDVPRASLAAVIDTEAAKVKGVWDPESFNPKSEAYGLTQFLESTWELQAKKSGTFLNQYANAAGYIGADNKVTNMEDLLSLRANPTLSIVAAADLDTQEFRKLGRVGVINPAALAPDQQAWFMYLGHHEGTPGAQQVWEGTMPSAGRAGAEARFTQNVPPSQQAELLSRYNNDYVQAYRYWIMDYINIHVDPSRFR